jgi:hypothetical protein
LGLIENAMIPPAKQRRHLLIALCGTVLLVFAFFIAVIRSPSDGDLFQESINVHSNIEKRANAAYLLAGRPSAEPLVQARLAKYIECPIKGVRNH